MSIYEAIIGGIFFLYILYMIMLDGQFMDKRMNRIVKLCITALLLLFVVINCIDKNMLILGGVGAVILVINMILVIRLGYKSK